MSKALVMTRQLYDNLEELKKLFEFQPLWLNEWERHFVTDSLQRYKEYKFEAYFNSAQESKVGVILEKIRSKAVNSF